MDPRGSPVLGILQVRTLGQVTMPSSREPFQPGNRTVVCYVSCTGRQVLYHQHRQGIQRHDIKSFFSSPNEEKFSPFRVLPRWPSGVSSLPSCSLSLLFLPVVFRVFSTFLDLSAGCWCRTGNMVIDPYLSSYKEAVVLRILQNEEATTCLSLLLYFCTKIPHTIL